MTTAPTPWEMTDTGNADRLVDRHAQNLRYCPDMGRWLVWDGTRWRLRPDDSEAWLAARESIESIASDSSEKLARHKLRSLSVPKLQAAVTLARRHPDMQVAADQLDADPHALNTPSGVIDLKTGGITPCTPNGLHTKVTGCGVAVDGDDKVDLNPPALMWNQFLRDTFGAGAPGDDLIDYVQEVTGLAAIGEVREHILPFLFGSGANGKSVFLDVLAGVFGDHAITAPANFLLAGRGDKHETEIARLRGARLVICSEINRGSTFDEAKVKLLTGGDELSGRFMRQDLFDFRPSHTLFLMGNHQPGVAAGGDGFWRRLRLIPFKYKVPEDRRVTDLAQRLIADEGPAILAWVVAGAKRVLFRGLRTAPQAVMEATGEYAEQEDPIRRFIDECCDLDTAAETKTAVLHGAYIGWARRNHERDLNAVHFGRAMSAAGHKSGKTVNTGGVRVYRGLRVRAEHLPAWSAAALSANDLSRN